jgi:membrane protease YdiL (CAAX protease family)
MTPVTALIIWGEEFGWRSYLQLRLLPGRPLLAAVAVGLIWGIWHVPLILMGYQYPDHRLIGLVVFPVSTVLLSIVLGWLRSSTGSIWPVCLAHASINTLGGSWLMVWFHGHPDFIFLSILGIFGWIPLGLVCFWIGYTGRLSPGKTLKQ